MPAVRRGAVHVRPGQPGHRLLRRLLPVQRVRGRGGLGGRLAVPGHRDLQLHQRHHRDQRQRRVHRLPQQHHHQPRLDLAEHLGDELGLPLGRGVLGARPDRAGNANVPASTQADIHYFDKWQVQYWSHVPHDNSNDTNFIATTPAGFSYLTSWGSARYNTAAQLEALAYRKNFPTDPQSVLFSNWAMGQMNYLMGDNPANWSYIVGFGSNVPGVGSEVGGSATAATHPHHGDAQGSLTNSQSDPATDKHILWGALVGGPSSADAAGRRDHRLRAQRGGGGLQRGLGRRAGRPVPVLRAEPADDEFHPAHRAAGELRRVPADLLGAVLRDRHPEPGQRPGHPAHRDHQQHGRRAAAPAVRDERPGVLRHQLAARAGPGHQRHLHPGVLRRGRPDRRHRHAGQRAGAVGGREQLRLLRHGQLGQATRSGCRRRGRSSSASTPPSARSTGSTGTRPRRRS